MPYIRWADANLRNWKQESMFIDFWHFFFSHGLFHCMVALMSPLHHDISFPTEISETRMS